VFGRVILEFVNKKEQEDMKTLGSETFQFMADLWENNNKAWFDENRKRYESEVRKPLKPEFNTYKPVIS